MLSFTDFVGQFTGKAAVGDTPENTGQCVGLVERWIDSLALPHVWGNAIDLLNNANKNAFTVVQNTPTNAPSEGDIVVLGSPYGPGVDSDNRAVYFGHTGIATAKCTADILELFEQNDPIGSFPHLNIYNYSSVLGWLHPLVLGNTGNSAAATTLQQVEDQLKQQVDATSSCLTQLKSATEQNVALQAQNTDFTKQVTDLQTQLKQANSNYVDEQNRNISLNDALKTVASENQDKGSQLLDAQHRTGSLQSFLQAFAGKLGIKTTGLSDADVADKSLTVLSEMDKITTAQDKKIMQLEAQIKQMPVKPQTTANPGILARFLSIFIR